MLTNKMKRTGLVLSIVWTILGGYGIYLQYSNQDFKQTLSSICSTDAKECADLTAMSKNMFATDWTSIMMYVAAGLFVIWLTLFLIAWIQRGDSKS